MRAYFPVVRLLLLASHLAWGTTAAHAQSSLTAQQQEAAQRVTAVGDEWVAESLIRNPEMATRTGVPDARHGEIFDNSLTALAQWEQREDRWLAALQRLNPDLLLGTPEWVVYGTLRERLEAARDRRVCREHLWSVNHFQGWQTEYPTLATQQPIGSAELRAAALSRFGKLPRYLDTEIVNLRQGLRSGYSASKLTVELTIKQLDNLLSIGPEQSPYFDPARRDSIPAFVNQWRTLLVNELNPALQRYRDFLRDEYLPAARETVAASANPDGAACYQAKVRQVHDPKH